MSEGLENSAVRPRLLEAALEEVAERGMRGATTRRIAHRAGVNEVTIFRQFGSKPALVAEALRQAATGFGSTAARPSGRLERDLTDLAMAYWAFVGANRGAMVRLLPELSRDPALGDAGGAVMGSAFASLLGLFRHYQEGAQAGAEREARPAAAGQASSNRRANRPLTLRNP